MAKGTKTGGRNWTKGESGNKNGAPHAYDTYKALIKRYSIGTVTELDGINLEEIPIKCAIVIKQIKKAYSDGDMRVIEWFADREEGKPKQITELSGSAGEKLENEITIKCVDSDGNVVNPPKAIFNKNDK